MKRKTKLYKGDIVRLSNIDGIVNELKESDSYENHKAICDKVISELDSDIEYEISFAHRCMPMSVIKIGKYTLLCRNKFLEVIKPKYTPQKVTISKC